MVYTSTGYAKDIERNYKWVNGGWQPLSRGGDINGRGKGTTYSQCRKPVKTKLAPDMPIMHGYSLDEIETKHFTVAPCKGKTVKIIKARYLKK